MHDRGVDALCQYHEHAGEAFGHQVVQAWSQCQLIVELHELHPRTARQVEL